MQIKLPYVVEKMRGGEKRYYWQPKKQDQEFSKPKRLGEGNESIRQEAERLYKELKDWRKHGEGESSFSTTYGSVKHGIKLYTDSRKYKILSEQVKRNYQTYINRIESQLGNDSAVNVDRPFCVELYENILKKYQQPRRAEDTMKVLGNIIGAMIDAGLYKNQYGMTMENPCKSLNIEHNEAREQEWSEKEAETFVTYAMENSYEGIGIAFILGYFFAQRKTDVIRAPKTWYKNGRLTLKQSKTGNDVSVKALPLARLLLNKYVRKDCLNLVAYYDKKKEIWKPYSAVGTFDKHFAACRKDAGIRKELQFRDTRATAATKLIEAGCTPSEAAAIGGWALKSCVEMVDRYANRTSKTADNAMNKVMKMERRK